MNETNSLQGSRPNFMIYGANGYTGELTARLAVERGLTPILAGRNSQAVQRLASELDLRCRLFALDNGAIVDAAIKDMAVVLHCAGPFWRTSSPMVDACIRTHTHYLDITGEIEVFEALAARYDEAREAGVMLLPGAGFDVVPSDCLAAHLQRRLPSATHLSLAIQTVGGVSRGTLMTMIEQMGKGNSGMVRRDERLTPVPSAWKTRAVDFGEGPMSAMTIPWGDVSTAYHSTGIPNIEVYLAAPTSAIRAAKLSRYAAWLMRFGAVQRVAVNRVRAGEAGPAQAAREQGLGLVWGMAEDAASGERVEARLRTPEAYTLTAEASLAMVERVLAGDAPVGYQTPSSAYGADFVLAVDGVTRVDL